MYTPTLLYTTEEHGCSLTTFYVRVEQHEPTLLMIKTCNNEVSSWRKVVNEKKYGFVIDCCFVRYLALIVQHGGMNVI